MNPTPESLLNCEYRKRNSHDDERIKFISRTKFWYKKNDGEWDERDYRQSEAGIELDWGNGNVYLCVFLSSSSQFVEFGAATSYWELAQNPAREDRGSTS